MKFNSVFIKENLNDKNKDFVQNNKEYNEKFNLSTHDENLSPNKRFSKNEQNSPIKVHFDNKLKKNAHYQTKSVSID